MRHNRHGPPNGSFVIVFKINANSDTDVGAITATGHSAAILGDTTTTA